MTRLDQIKERLSKVTPGEWNYQDTEDGCCGSPCTPDGCHECHPTGNFFVYGPEWEREYGKAVFKKEGDADFIAHAPSDIRHLLDEVGRLRDALNYYASFFQGKQGYYREEDMRNNPEFFKTNLEQVAMDALSGKGE